MKFEPFQLEKWLSVHKKDTKNNLGSGGVYPLKLRELLEETLFPELELGYLLILERAR